MNERGPQGGCLRTASRITSYDQAIEYLFSRINYERAKPGSYSSNDFKLERMRRLLELLGNPQERLPVVHIAGTKGKGSTSVMVAEILSAAGYRTGLFTSPHISVFEERMKVDGLSPSRERFVALVDRLIPSLESMDRGAPRMSPTYFEIATALAWLYFEETQADIAVLEVGLGGRLDATNLCQPEVTAITSISYDHMAVLGETLEAIAGEKAGIIKPGVPVISGADSEEARRVIEHVSQRQDAPLVQLGREIHYRRVNLTTSENGRRSADDVETEFIEITTPQGGRQQVEVTLPGDHQLANAAVAVGMIETLIERGWSIDRAAVKRGMGAVRCPLRIEVIDRAPRVVLDAAHNEASIAALIKTLNQRFRPKQRLLIFAATGDKPVRDLLSQLLPEFETVILTRYLNNPRAVAVEHLQSIATALSDKPVLTTPTPQAAWELACRLSRQDDLICVTGSFFVAAEIRALIVGANRTTEEAARL